MKKLSLKQLSLGNTEVLSREQLKKILGGDGSGGDGGSGGCTYNINCVLEAGYTQLTPATCSGAPVNGDCFPAEQECYNVANAWCDSVSYCSGCVPY